MKYIHFDKASIGKELKLGIPIALQEFLVGTPIATTVQIVLCLVFMGYVSRVACKEV